MVLVAFGMSAIAHVLLKTGYRVSGSDQNANELTANLTKQGGHEFSLVIMLRISRMLMWF